MSNKVVIGDDESTYVKRADDAERRAAEYASEVTMIRRRIRTFYNAITQVRFPASPPSWADDWVEWLLTGEVEVEVVMAEDPTDETSAEEAVIETEIGLVNEGPTVLGQDGLLPTDETVI